MPLHHPHRRPAVAATLIACLVAASAACRVAAAADDLETLEQRSLRAAVDSVAPSVVRIETVGGLERVSGVLFGTGPTSGLVVDKRGYVISSAFNFINQPTSILVRLPDGVRIPAELVATDHNRMLVLLKFQTDRPLPVPEFASHAETRVGQWTVAVGRAFDPDHPNLTVGVLRRNRIWGKALQTDAIVSPNNYGGPLVDIHGRVLGVIVPLSPQSTDEVAGVQWYDSGIGFAIPGDDVRTIVARLKKGEDLKPGLMGIGFKSPNLHVAEPVIGSCHPNSPADEAGLKPDDRILQIDGQKVARAADAKEQISRHYAGDRVEVVVRRDDEKITAEVELVAQLDPFEHPLLGVLPLRTGDPSGVPVRYVLPGGPAAEAGLEEGDVLLALDGESITDAGQLRAKLSTYQPEEQVRLKFRRDEKPREVKLTLATLPEGLPPEQLPAARAESQPPDGDQPDSDQPDGDRPRVGVVKLKIPEHKNEAWAYVPKQYDPAAAYGLVIWLHPPGGSEKDELLRRWRPLCNEYDLILLVPSSEDPARWRPDDAAFIGKLLDDVQSSYTVDPTRVVAHGHKAGGAMALLVAMQHRDVVRAVAAVDAPPVGRAPAVDPLHRFAVYIAKAEQGDQAKAVEQGIQRLRKLRVPVTVKPLGKDPRYLNAEELAQLARWIDMLDRI